MKKKIIKSAIIASLFLTVGIAFAAPIHKPFSFTKKGQFISLIGPRNAGTIKVKAELVSTHSSTSLNLNLSKDSFWGYNYISMCVKDVNGNTHTATCTWNNMSSGTYKGNIVVNKHNDGNTIQGEGYLLP